MQVSTQSAIPKNPKDRVHMQFFVRVLSFMLLAGGLLGATGLAQSASGKVRVSPQLNWSVNVQVDESSSDCYAPAIAVDASGGRYVLWGDDRNGSEDVYFDYSSQVGIWGTDQNVIMDPSNQLQRTPRIAVDFIGNAYAIWEDQRGDDWNIYFAFRPAGGSWQQNVRVNDASGAKQQLSPSIAVDGSGNACAVWMDARNDTGNGNWDIYADCRPAGGTWGQDQRVNDDTGTANQRYPTIAANAGGQFCAAWWDSRSGNQDTYFACRGTSNAWTANKRVNDISLGHWSPSYRGPALAIDGSGTAYALWEDYRAGNWDIYFAYHPLGESWQSHTRINDDLSADQLAPALSISPSGNLTAVWWDKRDGNGDIYSDYRLAGGDWGIDARVDDDAGSERQEYPDVVVDTAGRSHAVWQDYRGGAPHIFSATAPSTDIPAVPVYVPLILRTFQPAPTPTPIFEGPWEIEPNNTVNQANGPLGRSRDYLGRPSDDRDYFYLDLHTPGQIMIDLTNHTGNDVQLHLYFRDTSQRVDYDEFPPFHIEYTGQVGRYYILIYTSPASQSENPYTLRASLP